MQCLHNCHVLLKMHFIVTNSACPSHIFNSNAYYFIIIRAYFEMHYIYYIEKYFYLCI